MVVTAFLPYPDRMVAISDNIPCECTISGLISFKIFLNLLAPAIGIFDLAVCRFMFFTPNFSSFSISSLFGDINDTIVMSCDSASPDTIFNRTSFGPDGFIAFITYTIFIALFFPIILFLQLLQLFVYAALAQSIRFFVEKRFDSYKYNFNIV